MSRLFDFLFNSEKKKKRREIIKPKFPTVAETHQVVGKYLQGKVIKPMYPCRTDIPCVCPYCCSKLKSQPNLDYIPNKKKNDLYYTSDGFCIISKRLKDFFEQNGYQDLTFIKLNNCGFYFFEPNQLFQTNIHWTPFNEFKIWCNACKNFAELTGGVLKEEDFKIPTNDFVYRTNDFRGIYEYKYPLIIIGLETEQKMLQSKMEGITFEKVYG